MLSSDYIKHFKDLQSVHSLHTKYSKKSFPAEILDILYAVWYDIIYLHIEMTFLYNTVLQTDFLE